jgi:hypothetical protein
MQDGQSGIEWDNPGDEATIANIFAAVQPDRVDRIFGSNAGHVVGDFKPVLAEG